MLFDGEAVKSCTLLAPMLDGGTLTTIEGLSGRAVRTRCTRCSKPSIKITACNAASARPGMVMTAVALASEKSNPTEAEVRHGLEGNICRCTGYQNIVASVLARRRRHACAGKGE